MRGEAEGLGGDFDDRCEADQESYLSLIRIRMKTVIFRFVYMTFSLTQLSEDMSQKEPTERPLNERLQILSGKYWSTIFDPKYCSVPDCTGQRAIKAHSVSKRRHLNIIAKEGHVYWTHFDPVKFDPFGSRELKLEGISKATTFRGFCDVHDKMFDSIDTGPSSFEPEELCLHAYRTSCAEVWWRHAAYQAGVRIYGEEQLANTTSKTLTESANMLLEFQENFPNYELPENLMISPGQKYSRLDEHEYNIKASVVVREKWAKILSEKKYDEISAYVIQFSKTSPIASFVGHAPIHKFNGKSQHISMVQHPELPMCFAGILPTSNGSEFYLIWHRESDDYLVPFVETLRQIPHSGKTTAILQLFFMQDGNLAISPEWWDQLPNPSKEFLEEILFFSKAQGHSATYLRERVIQVEDWNVIVDGYLWSMPELATRYVQFSNEYLAVIGKLTDKSIVRKFDSCPF